MLRDKRGIDNVNTRFRGYYCDDKMSSSWLMIKVDVSRKKTFYEKNWHFLTKEKQLHGNEREI